MYEYVYYVYGWDRGTDDTVILHETTDNDEAIRWARGYCKKEDMGGWDKVFVAHRYQVDVDWEGEPTYSEHVSWMCWREPMDYPDNAMEEF